MLSVGNEAFCFFTRVLHFNLDFNTRCELQLHQRLDGLVVAVVDIDQTLVSSLLELLAALLVHECRTVYREDALVGGQGYRTANDSAGSLHRLDDLLSGFVHQVVVERFQFNTNLLTHFV